MGDPTANQGRPNIEVDQAHPPPGESKYLAALGGEIAGTERDDEGNDHDRSGYQPEDPNSSHTPRLDAVGRNR